MKMLFESIPDAHKFIESAEWSKSENSVIWQSDLIDRANNYIKLKRELDELEEDVHVSYDSLLIAARIREINKLMSEGF